MAVLHAGGHIVFFWRCAERTYKRKDRRHRRMNDGSACEHEMGKSCRRPLHAGRRPLRVLVRGRRRPLLLLVLRSPDVSVRSLNAPCLSFSSSENERTRSVHVLVQVTGCDTDST